MQNKINPASPSSVCDTSDYRVSPSDEEIVPRANCYDNSSDRVSGGANNKGQPTTSATWEYHICLLSL